MKQILDGWQHCREMFMLWERLILSDSDLTEWHYEAMFWIYFDEELIKQRREYEARDY